MHVLAHRFSALIRHVLIQDLLPLAMKCRCGWSRIVRGVSGIGECHV